MCYVHNQWYDISYATLYLAVRCSYSVFEVGLVSYLWMQRGVNCVTENLRRHNSDINKGIYTILCIAHVYV